MRLGEWLGTPRLADAAMGTALRRRGLLPGEAVESWVLARPDEVEAVHRRHAGDGAEVLLTATFGGNRARLRAFGLEARGAEIHGRAVEIARAASGGRALVAGDMGPTGAAASALSEGEASEIFEEQARWLLDAGVDLLWIETFGSPSELGAAVRGARRAGAVGLVATFAPHSRADPREAARIAREGGLSALGVNCGGEVGAVLDALTLLAREAPGLPLVAKPSAGAPGSAPLGPEAFGDFAVRAVGLGARLVGGCCGTTGEHLRAAGRALERDRLRRGA